MAYTSRPYSFYAEMRGTRGIVTNLNTIARALDATRLAATQTFQIDKQIRSLGVQMGQSAEQATRLASATLGLSNASGASIGTTTKLVTAYMRAGQEVKVLREGAQGAFSAFQEMTDESARLFRAQVNLVELFGMSAESVVKLRTQTKFLGIDFAKFIGASARFGREAGLPDMVGQTAKAFDFARSMLVKFGKATVDNAPAIVETTMQTGAVLAKTYGVDIVHGIDMAQQQQRRFIEQAQHDRDVFLGLSNDFDGLTKALMETGLGFDHIQMLTKKGREDPIAYARELTRILDTVKAMHGEMYYERTFQQIIRNSDAATAALLTNRKELEKAEEEQNLLNTAVRQFKISKGSLDDYERLVDSTRSIGAVLLESISNLADMFKTIIGTTFAKTISKTLEGVLPLIKNFNKYISETAESVANSDTWKRVEPVLVGIGKVLVSAGVAAGILASSIASAVVPIRLLVTVAERIPLIGKGVTAIDDLASSVMDFGKESFESVAQLSGLSIAFNDFGKTLKDKEFLDTPTLVLRAFRAMGLGLVETFDTLLGGIPTKIAKIFFPDMKRTLGGETRVMFDDLEAWLLTGTDSVAATWWTEFKTAVSKQYESFKDKLVKNFDDYNKTAEEWGQNIGRSIGSIAKWAEESLRWGWRRLKAILFGDIDDLTEDMDPRLLNIQKLIKTFVVNMVDESLRPWGMGWIEVKSKILDFWDSFKSVYGWFKITGLPTFQENWLSWQVTIVKSALLLKDTLTYAFSEVKNSVEEAMYPLLSAWKKAEYYYHKAMHYKKAEEFARAKLEEGVAAGELAWAKAQYAMGGGLPLGIGKRLAANLAKAQKAYDQSSADAARLAKESFEHADAATQAEHDADRYKTRAARATARRARGKTNYERARKAADARLKKMVSAEALKEYDLPAEKRIEREEARAEKQAEYDLELESKRDARHRLERQQALERDKKELRYTGGGPVASMALATMSTAKRMLDKSKFDWKVAYRDQIQSILDFLGDQAGKAQGDAQKTYYAELISAVKDARTTVSNAADPYEGWTAVLQALQEKGGTGIESALGEKGLLTPVLKAAPPPVVPPVPPPVPAAPPVPVSAVEQKVSLELALKGEVKDVFDVRRTDYSSAVNVGVAV